MTAASVADDGRSRSRAYRVARFLIVVLVTLVAIPVALALLVANAGERGR